MISTYIHHLSHTKIKIHYRTIIISDVHLGTPDAKHQEVFDFIKKNSCDNLILNWDIIDWRYLKYFRTFPSKQKELIKYVLDLWRENKTKITYIKWNHERFWKNILPITINNINFTKEIIYQSGNKKYLICHGQDFDKKIYWKYIIESISFLWWIFLFRLNRHYNNRRKKNRKPYFSIVSKIKRLAKKIALWWTKSFEERIVKTLKGKKCDWIICGHLHKPEIKKIWKYEYLNSGDRVESMTALVETKDNQRKIIYYK